MSNTMSYKGYTARIEYDDEDGIFCGRIAGISDGVGFHA
jgi:predicted HicB family RNase H-like nuclease